MGISETVGVNVDHREHREGISVVQSVLDVESYCVAVSDRQIGVDADRSRHPQPVSLPSNPKIGKVSDTLDLSNGGVHLADDLGLDSVEHPARHAASRASKKPENPCADNKPRHWIYPCRAERCSDCCHHDCQRGQSVRAGVLTIGDESLGSDRPSDPDPIPSHKLVTKRPDNAGDYHPGDVVDESRLEQSDQRLPDHQDRRETYRRDDQQTGGVFQPVKSIGVALGWSPTTNRECDPQWNSCQGVGDVVQRVGEERNRSTEHDDHRLKYSRGSQHEKRDLGSADTFGARVQDKLMIGYMIVAQQMPEPMLESVLA